MSSIEGGGIIGGGMEFPMMTLIGDYRGRNDSALYNVTAHELAHMWVPMIVGIDERRHAWMDEGTTTFNENQARTEYFPGVNHNANDREEYVQTALMGMEGEMMRRTDYHYSDQARGIASYSKPATILVALRALLGEEAFTRGYHEYIADWAYKHPKPHDFFNAFNQAAGRDLDWFWRSWYYETWTLDQAISSVTDTDSGTQIVIEDLGLAPMPVRRSPSTRGSRAGGRRTLRSRRRRKWSGSRSTPKVYSQMRTEVIMCGRGIRSVDLHGNGERIA
jgi:hypothetical protein